MTAAAALEAILDIQVVEADNALPLSLDPLLFLGLTSCRLLGLVSLPEQHLSPLGARREDVVAQHLVSTRSLFRRRVEHPLQQQCERLIEGRQSLREDYDLRRSVDLHVWNERAHDRYAEGITVTVGEVRQRKWGAGGSN